MNHTIDRDGIRQRILGAIHAGRTLDEIADILHVSRRTVERCRDGSERWAGMSKATVQRMADNLAGLRQADHIGDTTNMIDEPTPIPTGPAPEPTLPVARHTGMLAERMHEGQAVYSLQDVADALGVTLPAVYNVLTRRAAEFQTGRDTIHVPLNGYAQVHLTRRGAMRVAMHSHGPNALALQNHLLDLDEASVTETVTENRAPLSEVDKLALVLGVKLPELAAATIEAHAMAKAAVITATEQAERLTQLEADMEARPMLRRRLHKAVGKLADKMAGVGMHSREVSKNARWLNDRIGQRWGVRDALTARQLNVALEWVAEQHDRVNKRLPLIEVLTAEPGAGLADEVQP